jgi:hypothetical protein
VGSLFFALQILDAIFSDSGNSVLVNSHLLRPAIALTEIVGDTVDTVEDVVSGNDDEDEGNGDGDAKDDDTKDDNTGDDDIVGDSVEDTVDDVEDNAVKTVNTLDNDMSGKEDQSNGGNVHLQEKGSTILAPSESLSKQIPTRTIELSDGTSITTDAVTNAATLTEPNGKTIIGTVITAIDGKKNIVFADGTKVIISADGILTTVKTNEMGDVKAPDSTFALSSLISSARSGDPAILEALNQFITRDAISLVQGCANPNIRCIPQITIVERNLGEPLAKLAEPEYTLSIAESMLTQINSLEQLAQELEETYGAKVVHVVDALDSIILKGLTPTSPIFKDPRFQLIQTDILKGRIAQIPLLKSNNEDLLQDNNVNRQNQNMQQKQNPITINWNQTLPFGIARTFPQNITSVISNNNIYGIDNTSTIAYTSVERGIGGYNIMNPASYVYYDHLATRGLNHDNMTSPHNPSSKNTRTSADNNGNNDNKNSGWILQKLALNNGQPEQMDVDIAILDTGVSLNHPDLDVYRDVSIVGNITSGNDDQGHGSHVAGIAAAKNNGIGVVGIAPGAKLWAVKVCDAKGECKVSDQMKGVDYVIKHADEIDILNISLENPNSPALNKIINEAIKAGITVVAAAGNFGKDASTTSPANNHDILTVSAIGDSDGKCGGVGPIMPQFDGNVTDDAIAYFSNFGPVVKMAAPGVNVLSTYNGSGYALDSGTSMAASHVAGAAALYKAMFPDATPAQVMANITNASIQPHTHCDGGSQGYFTGDLDGINEPFLFQRWLSQFME